jgi:hypothetical protein
VSNQTSQISGKERDEPGFDRKKAPDLNPIPGLFIDGQQGEHKVRSKNDCDRKDNDLWDDGS